MIEIVAHTITLRNCRAHQRFQVCVYGHRWTHVEVARTVLLTTAGGPGGARTP
jgi:hypothetical protein